MTLRRISNVTIYDKKTDYEFPKHKDKFAEKFKLNLVTKTKANINKYHMFESKFRHWMILLFRFSK